jgi:hypothetical protein
VCELPLPVRYAIYVQRIFLQGGLCVCAWRQVDPSERAALIAAAPELAMVPPSPCPSLLSVYRHSSLYLTGEGRLPVDTSPPPCESARCIRTAYLTGEGFCCVAYIYACPLSERAHTVYV